MKKLIVLVLILSSTSAFAQAKKECIITSEANPSEVITDARSGDVKVFSKPSISALPYEAYRVPMRAGYPTAQCNINEEYDYVSLSTLYLVGPVESNPKILGNNSRRQLKNNQRAVDAFCTHVGFSRGIKYSVVWSVNKSSDGNLAVLNKNGIARVSSHGGMEFTTITCQRD